MGNEQLDRRFTARRFFENSYVITGEGCDSYLLLGENEGLMIDTGMSRRNLKEFVSTLTDLPVNKVINTHGHFDHTGGNGFFSEVMMHPDSVPAAKVCFGNPLDYPLDYTIVRTLVEGDVIDLGERRLEIIEIPAHSPGSIAILDIDNRLLFTGDELESAQVLLLGSFDDRLLAEGLIKEKRPVGTVGTHRENMKKLQKMESRFDIICPAHNGTPITKDYIEAYIEAADLVLSGKDEGKKEIDSPSYNNSQSHFPKDVECFRRIECKGASIIYRRDLGK